MKLYTGIKPCIQEADVQKNKIVEWQEAKKHSSQTEPIKLNKTCNAGRVSWP